MGSKFVVTMFAIIALMGLIMLWPIVAFLVAIFIGLGRMFVG